MKIQMLQRLLLVTLLFLGCSTTILSQTGGIKGFVTNEKDGSAVLYSNVILKGTTYGIATDGNGFYSISKVPAGDYTITISAMGFATFEKAVTIEANKTATMNIGVKESSVDLNIFDVNGEKQESQTQVKMSVTKITPQEINQLPTIGGEADFAQYMQVVPGVIFTGDQGGQLYIRGGSPVQNKILLDGMVVYNAFHSIGLFSVFDADIMQSADVYTGGFSGEYGGRVSSIMDITTRAGNNKRLSGKVSLSTFGAKALLEGPLKKAKTKNDGTISYILSAKTSYLDQSSKTLYSYADSNGLPYKFNDLYGKISFAAPSGSKADLFGFNFTDDASYRNGTSIGWRNFGGGGRFLLLPKGSSAIVEGNLAVSRYLIQMDEPSARTRKSGVNGFNFGIGSTYFTGDNEFKFGIDIVGFTTDFEYTNKFGREFKQQENNTELGMFAKYKLTFGDLIIDPSIRIQYYASLSTISPEPRFGAKYNITDDFRVKGAVGMYSQNLIAANSDRDIVNLFYGFLSGPESLQEEYVTKNGETKPLNNRLQKANHYILGFEYDLWKGITINLEGYYKQFNQLININRNKLYEDADYNADKPDILKKDFIVETGDAYGADLSVKWSYKQFYLWSVYSLTKITRWDGIQEYSPVFDRRHNVNLVGAYTFGKDLNWEANVRYNFGSGFPFTQTQGLYEEINFAEGYDQDYSSANGNLNALYSDLNQGRLPAYARLDANIKRTWTLGAFSEFVAAAGITNVLNRANIFYYDRLSNTRVNQLPFMPNASISLTF